MQVKDLIKNGYIDNETCKEILLICGMKNYPDLKINTLLEVALNELRTGAPRVTSSKYGFDKIKPGRSQYYDIRGSCNEDSNAEMRLREKLVNSARIYAWRHKKKVKFNHDQNGIYVSFV